LGSIKGGELLDQQSDYQLLSKKDLNPMIVNKFREEFMMHNDLKPYEKTNRNYTSIIKR
jgi:hypothetical protein